MPRELRSVSRRTFLASACASGIAGAFLHGARAESPARRAVSQSAPRAVAGPKSRAAPRRGDLFDVHVHLTQEWFGRDRGPLTADLLLHWMDAHGVAGAAVLPLVSPEAFWYPIATEWVLSQCREHSDRLVPFCAVDPRTLGTHLPTRVAVIELLKRYIDAGARGFGEHKPRLAIDDPLSMKLYDACNEVKLPVLFHLDNQANMDKPGLPGLNRVLTTFPDLVLIGHGKGWWASIAGGLMQDDLHVGYPPGRVAAGGAIDAMMDKHPRLFGDLSSSGAHALLRDAEFGKRFLRRRAERLLFGTDYYDLTQREFEQFDLFGRLDAPADVRRKVGGDNARGLLARS